MATFMKIVAFFTVIFVSGILADDLPDWDAFAARFPSFTKLPMSENQAKSEGWHLVNDACEGNKKFYVGRQYSKKTGDKTRMLLFDVQGKIAGFQMAYSNQLRVAKNHINGLFMKDVDDYVITTYFTDPKSICKKGGTPRRAKFVGENLYLLNGKNTMRIPLKQTGMAGTKWVEGKCFIGMGKHYWYNISEDMDCDDFFPIFLLYNGGVLNGFGFALNADLVTGNVEHPPKPLLSLFFNKGTKPKCLAKEKHLSTQHVYLQRRPYFNLC